MRNLQSRFCNIPSLLLETLQMEGRFPKEQCRQPGHRSDIEYPVNIHFSFNGLYLFSLPSTIDGDRFRAGFINWVSGILGRQDN